MPDENHEPDARYESRGVIEFAEWQTPVENDHLRLVNLKFHSDDLYHYPTLGISLGSVEPPLSEPHCLEVTFLSLDKRSMVHFKFCDVAAFRVLDEAGLVDMWAASAKTRRPGQSTFRVRGHPWQKESYLAWFHGTDKDEYSYLVATDWFCLEVVAYAEPEVRLEPAVVTSFKAT